MGDKIHNLENILKGFTYILHTKECMSHLICIIIFKTVYYHF